MTTTFILKNFRKGDHDFQVGDRILMVASYPVRIIGLLAMKSGKKIASEHKEKQYT